MRIIKVSNEGNKITLNVAFVAYLINSLEFINEETQSKTD
jgi:hypothetical protein